MTDSSESVTCVLSGKQTLRSEMLRLVALPADIADNVGAIIAGMRWCIDRQGNLPGKYHWVYPDAAVMSNPQVQGVFQCTPKKLHQLLLEHLFQRVRQMLHGIRRSGEYCIGGDSIKQWWIAAHSCRQITHTDATTLLLLGAYDGGSSKLWSYLRTQWHREANYRLHSQQQLGEVFDREKLGSVLLYNSGLCRHLQQDMQSWQRLLGSAPGS